MGIDEPLARIEANDKVRYYQRDALGSVIALTDETGIIKTQYTYDPFGNVTISGEASDNPFQYAGRENDNTGLYYYRARYYSPELQRFISKDPIGLVGGINLYSYVGNNPVNEIDPIGLMASKPPTPSLGDWIPPSKLPCGMTPDQWCAAEYAKKVKACAINTDPGCMEKARRWFIQCQSWVDGIIYKEIPCPPQDCKDKDKK